jgi:hypothetical protein
MRGRRGQRWTETQRESHSLEALGSRQALSRLRAPSGKDRWSGETPEVQPCRTSTPPCAAIGPQPVPHVACWLARRCVDASVRGEMKLETAMLQLASPEDCKLPVASPARENATSDSVQYKGSNVPARSRMATRQKKHQPRAAAFDLADVTLRRIIVSFIKLPRRQTPTLGHAHAPPGPQVWKSGVVRRTLL